MRRRTFLSLAGAFTAALGNILVVIRRANVRRLDEIIVTKNLSSLRLKLIHAVPFFQWRVFEKIQAAVHINARGAVGGEAAQDTLKFLEGVVPLALFVILQPLMIRAEQ